MLNRDLLRIERDAVRQATGVLTAANDASESNEQRDARARDLLAEIVDSSPEAHAWTTTPSMRLSRRNQRPVLSRTHRGAASRYHDLRDYGQRPG